MATGLNGFAERLQKAEFGEFEVRPYYEEHTDSLIVYFQDTRSYSKRINKYLTIFLSIQDDDLIGIEVKGLKIILKAIENLGETEIAKPVNVNVDGKQTDLRVVVMCALLNKPEEHVSGQQYEKLESRTEGINIPFPESPSCA